MKRIWLLLFVCGVGLRAQSSADLDSIDRYIGRALAEWNVPGLAIAIVKNDSAIFSKGYGVRTIGKNEPVDAHTNFAIASLTKAMTAAAVGILVDEGKLKWDDPVTNYLPDFQMPDPFVTREMTVRDLLCHRSGLETFSGDLVWYGTNYSRDEVLRRTRFLKPKFSFRSQYGYQNIMYLAAGEVVAQVSGTPWDEFVKKRIFNPLGMTRTTTEFADLKRDNLATPHSIVDKKPVPVDYRDWDNIAPAGSTVSNVTDMAQWIRLQLRRGVYRGDTIFSKAVSRTMWAPQTLLTISENGERIMPSRHFLAYGLGWFMHDYHGRKLLNHSGGADGMISRICLLPEDNIGFVILTNSISNLSTALMYQVADRLLGTTDRDWGAFYMNLVKKSEADDDKEQKKLDSLRVKNTKPSLKLEKYTGTYGGELYGDAVVGLEKNQLTIRFLPTATFTGDLSHWHYDVFRIVLKDKNLPQKGFVNFILGNDGNVVEMKIDIPNPDFDFTELTFKKKP